MTEQTDDDTPPDLLPDEVLARYFARESSDDEREMVARWVEASPERRKMLDMLRAGWSFAGETARVDWRTAEAWETLQGQRHQPQAVDQIQRRRPDTRRIGRSLATSTRSRGWTALVISTIAATIIVAATATLAARWRKPGGVTLDPGREYATVAGQRETITLSDGTELTLAPATKVRVGGGYGQVRRDVYLVEGAAYFAVTHDKAHPFAVHVRNAVAQDLGTRFVVRSYAEEPAVAVVVADGVVSLADTSARSGRPLVLRRGALGTVDRAGLSTITANVDTSRYLGWTMGQLVFHATSLGDIAKELSRFYGLDVRLSDSALARRTFTGSYRAESPDEVLDQITTAIGARYERRDRVVTIHSR